jgi:hypothetical protein
MSCAGLSRFHSAVAEAGKAVVAKAAGEVLTTGGGESKVPTHKMR